MMSKRAEKRMLPLECKRKSVKDINLDVFVLESEILI